MISQPNPSQATRSPVSQVLTLRNEPAGGSFALRVQASESDPPTWFTPVTAESDYVVDGLSEGWGQDYQDFLDFRGRPTNLIPRPDDYRIGLDRLRRTYHRLQISNPAVVARMQPELINQERVIRNFQRHR